MSASDSFEISLDERTERRVVGGVNHQLGVSSMYFAFRDFHLSLAESHYYDLLPLPHKPSEYPKLIHQYKGFLAIAATGAFAQTEKLRRKLEPDSNVDIPVASVVGQQLVRQTTRGRIDALEQVWSRRHQKEFAKHHGVRLPLWSREPVKSVAQQLSPLPGTLDTVAAADYADARATEFAALFDTGIEGNVSANNLPGLVIAVSLEAVRQERTALCSAAHELVQTLRKP